jgi:hypothetical protein
MRALALLGLGAGIPAAAEPPAAPDPLALVQQMHDALGGASLDAVAGVQLSGHYELSGLRGSFRQTLDFKHGRDLFSYDVGLMRRQQATTAQGSWWTDEKGLPNVEDAPESMADAATQS